MREREEDEAEKGEVGRKEGRKGGGKKGEKEGETT